jgi:parvulin-like peptidyl-prolyl isomerase
VGFLIYCGLALYKIQSSSSFIYGITRAIPFPVAKVGSDYVSYENYLFELRHYEHYYHTQQHVDFNSNSGKRQLTNFKKQALQQVIDNTYIKQLAVNNHVTVSNQDVNNEISLVRSQNRLGSSDQVFRDALQNFWGWSVSDFKREIRQQLLAEKVVAKLDKGTNQRAEQALDRLNHGAKFDRLAAKVSDDTSAKKNGGQYSGWIDQSNRDIAPQVTAALFKLEPNQYSDIINTGYSLEIVKVLERKDDKVRAAHISFNLNSINTYVGPLKSHETTHRYITIK